MRMRAMGVAFVFLLVSVASGSPQILTYQGSLLRPGGSAVGDGSYDMRFSIYDVASGGASLWTETDTGVQVTGGLFSTILGDGTAFSSMFFPWHYNLWLEVEIDVDRNAAFDGDELFSPRQRLTAAPWAMDADRLNGRDAGAFLSSAMPLTLEVTSSTVAIQMVNPADIVNVDDIEFNSAYAPFLDLNDGDILDVDNLGFLTDGTGAIDMNNGDINDVDDLGFRVGGNASIDLNLGDIIDVDDVTADDYYFRVDPTFYRNYSHMDMVTLDDNEDDHVMRHSLSPFPPTVGFAYISSGSAPYDALIGTGVHVPQGATITELRAVVFDNDSSGQIAVDLVRISSNGTFSGMASVVTTQAFADSNVQYLADSSIDSPVVSNAIYTYALRVTLLPSGAGMDGVRFYSARVQFTMPRVAP